jgi:DNA-binding response OmpR family regulator
MKRLLLVDNDAALLRSYRDRLSSHGFQVNTATDAPAAISILRSAKPDLVVLELLLKDQSGVEVLRFIRSQPRLASTPVVVLTSVFMNDTGRQAAAIGIEKALLKSQCSPSVLMSVIDELLEGMRPPTEDTSLPETASIRVAAESGKEISAESEQASSDNISSLEQKPTAADAPSVPFQEQRPTEARPPGSSGPIGMLAHGPGICANLRKLFKELAQAPKDETGQKQRLQDFYRKVHYLSATTALAAYPQIAQVVAVFKGLLFALAENPARLNPAVLRTLAGLVDCMELLFQRARATGAAASYASRVLVVDDDPTANRLVISALQQVKLEARSTEDPSLAWQWVQQEHYDVFLLDIEMPGMDGLEFCKRLRALPAFAKKPVIFITGHADFQHRAKVTLSGGDELVSKPILPMELAAKVVMHLVRKQPPA